MYFCYGQKLCTRRVAFLRSFGTLVNNEEWIVNNCKRRRGRIACDPCIDKANHIANAVGAGFHPCPHKNNANHITNAVGAGQSARPWKKRKRREENMRKFNLESNQMLNAKCQTPNANYPFWLPISDFWLLTSFQVTHIIQKCCILISKCNNIAYLIFRKNHSKWPHVF